MYSQNKLKKSSNTFDPIKPFYYISKCIGTAPFTITAENNIISIKITRKDYLIFVFFNIVHAYFLYFVAKEHLDTNLLFDSSSNIGNFGQNIMVMATLSSAIFYNFINYLFKDKTVEIIKALIKIDLQMSFINIEVDHKVLSKIIIKYILLCILLIIIYTGLTSSIFLFVSILSQNTFMDIAIALILIINNIFFTNILCQFIVSLLSVYVRFKKLNESFGAIFKNDKQDQSEIVISLSKIHDSLIEIIEKINYRFSAWIMMSFAGIFVFSTICIFSFVRALIIFNKKTLLMCLPGFIWSMYFLMFLVVVIAVASATTRIVLFNNKNEEKLLRKLIFCLFRGRRQLF